ncbi:E3 ubiquitin/ISG15 ligase TRIM25-like isoform X2 [Lethenteron reissneri]|uniref:E3 ubiquitin/ISG15 ligase TRIM25-like isoform X2 n=1 Tax=Lethenteron reissneri TaxID=7753 RepID=UPI002AB605D4|nr:E3 ubiquitin/ISG15 ligase TRIM25-like isoform X2 [Lethenteron reissneri]
MASATPSESVDSELCCSICLGKFVCPSTLSCGHSFCLRCLEAAWETASSFSCPQCQATFPVRPQLRKNVALANLAEQLRVGDGMAAAVVCDICTDGQTPAVRTCVKCEMSYCARHARPHLENLRLSDHVLVAPIANLEGRRCRQHRQEQIKFYCEQDESLVCTVCTIAGEHRGHEVIPVENAQQTKQEAFRLEKTGKEEKKTTAESRKQQLKGAYKRVQESLRGTKARISREFERRREQLREEEREALERVDEEGRSVLSRIQADIARYESRVRGLEQEINQLLAALTVQDPLSFLQVFANSLMSHSAVNRRRLCGEEELETLLPKLDRATQRRSSVSQETQDDPDPVSHGLNLAKMDAHRLWTQTQPVTASRFPRISGRRRGALSPRVAPITHIALMSGAKPCAPRASRRVSTTGRWTWGARGCVGLESRTGRSHGEGSPPTRLRAAWEGVTYPGV